MGQLFGKKHKSIPCHCCPPENPCSPCPPGTIYPWAVDVSFPSLGVTQPAGNELDPEEDGETTFLYRVEGSYGGYSFQCVFGECEANIVIIQDSDGSSICIGGGAVEVAVSMEAVACPPDALTLIYTITCNNGSTFQVVITG